MSAGWDENQWARVESGLARLGWSFDGRVTNEDSSALLELADRANAIDESDPLFEATLEHLANEVFCLLGFYVMEVGERAAMLTGPYAESRYMPEIVPLIDEATLAYYRGYYTSSFAVLLIALERYLRSILADTGSRTVPSFAELRRSVVLFPASDYRRVVEHVLRGLYSRYDTLTPTRFYFNRHGLLHGLRKPMVVDRLNSCRTFQLFDLLLGAETGRISRHMDDRSAFDKRYAAYSACAQSQSERLLLGMT